jgi:hypothetical protein
LGDLEIAIPIYFLVFPFAKHALHASIAVHGGKIACLLARSTLNASVLLYRLHCLFDYEKHYESETSFRVNFEETRLRSLSLTLVELQTFVGARPAIY